jgi:hypothetical protein
VRPFAYRDPLDEIWLGLAARLGLLVERAPDAYAKVDRGVLTIGTPETLDRDDCLAQMILHELCHALVEGEGAWTAPDWGLDNTSERDRPREEACLRTQAALLRPHGLRRVLAPTTDYRAFYDALPEDPLWPRAEATCVLARLALARAARPPVAPHLEAALAATAAIVRAARPFAAAGSILAAIDDPATTPVGRPVGPPEATCGGCAWRAGGRCRQAARRVDPAWPACDRFEAELDCRACGACCREAYQVVVVGAREPVRRAHPEMVVDRDGALELRRAGDRCVALAGDGGGYTCTIYADRPRTCRDFERGGGHCLTARRRVGLSL